jgi:hypothetical protein
VSLLISHDDDLEGAHFTPGKQSTKSWKRPSLHCLRLLQQGLLYTFALIGTTSTIISIIRTLRLSGPSQVMYDSEYSATYEQPPCYCGSTVAEARATGCIYDELSTSWLPSHCRDDELTAEFTSLGDSPAGGWMYWADKNHTQPLTLDQVSQYADIQPTNFHMSYEWHRQHCFFLWRKEHRMKAKRMVYDPRSDSEHHILHCIMMLSMVSNGTAAGATLIG